MKFGIKLSDIKLGDVSIGGVEVNTELSINEMVAIRKETEVILENMPVYLDNLKVAMDKVVEIDNSMTEQEVINDIQKETVESIMESIKKKLGII